MNLFTYGLRRKLLAVMLCVFVSVLGFLFSHPAFAEPELVDAPEIGRMTMENLGTVIGPAQDHGDGRYDLQPTIMYDPEQTNDPQAFKMWWFSQLDDSIDLKPQHHIDGDRIYYSTSEHGQNWSTPQIVLKPQAGMSDLPAADDHTLGSPSVIKQNDIYYMFYECYGQWITAIRRFYQPSHEDTWVTNGEARQRPEWTSTRGDYQLDIDEPLLGFAPRYKVAHTHPIFSCEITYASGVVDRFLTLGQEGIAPDCARPSTISSRALNNGQPVFWAYDDDDIAPDKLQPLYQAS